MSVRIPAFAVAATVIAAAVAVPASAQPAFDKAPEWLKRPTDADLLSVWPAAALRDGKGGVVMIDCQVAVQGTLYNCRVASERPAGGGFGSAALTLTPQFLMKPAMKGGKPVGGALVRIPIEFSDLDAPIGSHLKGVDRRAFVDEVLSNVPWREAPSFADVAAAYPERARKAGKGGVATLNCRINNDGRLSGCQTLKEEPSWMGFGGAARKLADRFAGPTQLGDGSPIGGRFVQIAFAFAPEMIAADRPVVGKPQWAKLPAALEVARLYPTAARKARVGGRAAINCLVGVGGRLEDCRPVSETPKGHGFGAAALTLSERFAVKVWSSEGLPTLGGRITVPIRFEPPSAEELAAEAKKTGGV